MRILVTGATGLIGTALSASLTRDRHDVVVVSRRKDPGNEAQVTWDGFEAEIGRADAVVHLAGEPVAGARWTPAHLERVRASRVDTTTRIAVAIERAARKPRVWVSGSGIGIYGMRNDDEVLDERSPTAHGDVLAQICVAWEKAADPAREAGVRVVHPRIGMVVARGGGALARLVPAFRWLVGGALGGGHQWVSWVHLCDVVRAIRYAIDEERCVGPVNVVAPGPVRMNDFARELGRALHRPSILRVPAVALRVAVGEGLAQLLLTGQRVAPGKLEEAGFRFDFPRLREALADLYGPEGRGR